MRFSAFARFGHLRFSSKRAIAETIYRDLRAALGGEENLGDDEFAGPMAGKLFATAMALANAQRSIDHVNTEFRPGLSRELLSVHETDFRVVPPISATEDERRAELDLADDAAKGNSASVVDLALANLLGDNLIAVRRFGLSEAVASPSNWDTTGPGVWKSPDTIGSTHRLVGDVMPGLSVLFETVTIWGPPFVNGDEVIVDPLLLGVEERITIIGDGSGNLRANFVRAHEAGALISSKPWPRVSTTGRHLLVVVPHDVAISQLWRKRVAKLLNKILRSTDRWSLVDEYASGQLGPFIPGQGIPGVTPLVQTTTAPP